MKKVLNVLLSVFLSISCVACSTKEEPIEDSNENVLVEEINGLNAPLVEGNKANSAPYVIVSELWDDGIEYRTFSADWRCDIDAENTYYNVHCWYGNGEGEGYCGFQNVNGEHVVILSIWDNGNQQPTIEFSKKNAQENRFGNEGTGCNVITPYNWQVGKWYSMKVHVGYQEGTKSFFDLYVKEEGKDWEIISTISFPKPNLTMKSTLSFLEDFTYNGLERGHSLKNLQAMKVDEAWMDIHDVYLSHYDSKMFEKENTTLKCTFSTNNGILSIRSSGKDIVSSQQFPTWVSF